MTLLRCLTFLLRSLTDSHSPALLDLFISSDARICSTVAFPPFGNSDHAVVSNSEVNVLFHSQLMIILMLIGTVFVIIWELLHGRISLKLASAIFYRIFISHQMIALQKLLKMFLFHSKSSFHSRDIQIFVFPSSTLFPPVSHCFKAWLKTNLKV